VQGGNFSMNWGRNAEAPAPDPPLELLSPPSPRFFFFVTFFTMVLLFRG